MELKYAVNKLIQSLRDSEELYYGYQSNISMSFYDEFTKSYSSFNEHQIDNTALNEICNQSAKNFLNLFIKQDAE